MRTLVLLVVAAASTVRANSSPLVNVSVYSEALCPDCDRLTEGEMNEAVEKIGEIFSLHFVPWGNALLNPDGSFNCQHGEIECAMNTLEACVLKYYPSRSMWWPFIVCLEAHGYSQTWEIAQKCAEKQNMTWTEVKNCAEGPMGKLLELMYYEETASLNPPHQYTPWVLVNNKHIKETHIIKKICAAYQGANKPKACMHTQQFPPINGCYKEPVE